MPWGEVGEIPNWMIQWDELHKGNRVHVVLEVVIFDTDRQVLVGKAFPCSTMVRVKGQVNWDSNFSGVTILNGCYDGLMGSHQVSIHEDSKVLGHSGTDGQSLMTAIESCAGLGIGSIGIEQAGFNIAAANDVSATMLEAYGKLHHGVQVVVGDIRHDSTLESLHRAAPHAAVLAAGFSCQPFSSGGLQLGSGDDRSCSLPGILRAGLFLRKPIIILECVANAASNRFVRCQLETFAKQCGYRLSEVILRLEDVWVSKRERWWAVLMVASLGDLKLSGFVPGPYPSVVQDVLPKAMTVSVEEFQQLFLSHEEHCRFRQFCDLHKLILPRKAKCPTALHSWGSQVTVCPCGCRSHPFSDATLSSRGIYGVLMPIDDPVTIDDKQVMGFRHLHPSELAILTCVPLPNEWPRPLRLILAGLGQQANPLQSTWVAGQVHRHLDLVLGVSPPFDFDAAMVDLIKIVISQAKELLTDSSDESVTPIVESGLPEWVVKNHTGPSAAVTLQFEASACSDVVAISSMDATVGQLRAAEVQINPTADLWEVVDCSSLKVLSSEDCVAGRSLFIRPCELNLEDIVVSQPTGEVRSDEVMAESSESHGRFGGDVSPTVPFSLDLPHEGLGKHDGRRDPLEKLSPTQLLEVPVPKIASLDVLHALRSQQIASTSRLAIHDNQGSLWADDEIVWHLQDIIAKSGHDKWAVLDPLVASEVALHRTAGHIVKWYQQCGKNTTGIVSCVIVHGHWIPLVWTWHAQLLVCRSWDRLRVTALNLSYLHEAVALAVGASKWTTHVSHRSFSVDSHCGVCAVRFIDAEIRGKMLPTSSDEVELLHNTGRGIFRSFLQTVAQCGRPWVWGDGLDPHAHRRVSDLLCQHGVPEEAVEARIGLMNQALGIAAVQKAAIGSSPWRALKSIANQTRPPFQLVLPGELANAVQLKASQGGQQSKKKKGAGKGISAPPVLDASRLKLEPGYFVKPDGAALKSLAASQIGPFAEGVTLTTLQDVESFLKAGKPVSQFPLAAALINVDCQRLQTSLPWAEMRIPLRCVANDEPMLVNACVVQLGSVYVTTSKGAVVEVEQTPAACVKIAVYREDITIPWADFITRPVKHILESIRVLQSCDAPDCDCDRRHSLVHKFLKDPVLDVWRRQWLSLSFKATSPDQASLFLVNIRYVQDLEQAVLSCSGSGGLYTEPRTLDGRSPILEWQVLWLHRHSLKDVLHIKQCQPHVVGAVRLGSRFGVRVHSSNAVEVGAKLKPDTVMLAAGPRLDFEFGPIPFGSDRAAINRLCNQWKWQARAINPLRTLDDKVGMMWHVQAACDPPAKVFSTQAGEVVIARMPPKNSQVSQQSAAIGSSNTLGLCSLGTQAEGSDPWANYNDPWSAGLKKIGMSVTVEDPAVALRQVEDRIERAVLAKIPKIESMDVDGGGSKDFLDSQEARFQSVEAHIQQLVQHQKSLDQKIDANAMKSDAQVSQMQCQFAAQIDAQSSRMEDMFSKQMDQISVLLAKRARME